MSEDKSYMRKMTPVRIIEGNDGVQVAFLESARFYELAQADPEFDSSIAILRQAVENNETVEVNTDSIDSDVIKNIKPAN